MGRGWVLWVAACLVVGCGRSGAASAAADDLSFLTRIVRRAPVDERIAVMAGSRARLAETRRLAEEMRRDEEQLRIEATALAQRKRVVVDGSDETRVALQQNLEILSPEQFDIGYVLGTVQGLNALIRDLERASSSRDAEVRAFAAHQLPAAKARQREASALLDKMGGSPFGYPP